MAIISTWMWKSPVKVELRNLDDKKLVCRGLTVESSCGYVYRHTGG